MEQCKFYLPVKLVAEMSFGGVNVALISEPICFTPELAEQKSTESECLVILLQSCRHVQHVLVQTEQPNRLFKSILGLVQVGPIFSYVLAQLKLISSFAMYYSIAPSNPMS